MNIFGRILASVRWVRAIDLAAKGQHLNALRMLEKIYSYFSKYPEYFLLRGVVKVMLPDPTLSVDDLIQAKKLVAGSKKYNFDEKKYLLIFANNLLPPSKRDIDVSDAQQEILDGMEFDIAKVGPHLQQKFPLNNLQKLGGKGVSEMSRIKRTRS